MFDRCLYFNLNTLTRTVNKIWDQAFESFELSPAHAYLLRLVLANPGLSQRAIALELGLEKSTIARFTEALQAKGMLKRKKKGREQLIYPSDAALEIADRLAAKGQALFETMTGSIGQQTVSSLVGELKKTNQILASLDRSDIP